MKIALPCALLLSGLAFSAAWADYQDGVDAYRRGDFLGALDEWRPLAEAGDAIAQNSIGALYDRGLGVTENNVEAARWYLSAAELGLPLAMRNLGALYAAGDGLPQDLTVARRWFERAAAQGDQPSADWLQRMQIALPPTTTETATAAEPKPTPAPATAAPAPANVAAAPPVPANPTPPPAPVAPAAPEPSAATPASAPAPIVSASENWMLGFWQGPSLGCPPEGGLEFAADRLRSWYGGRVSAELMAAYAIAGDLATVTTTTIDGARQAIAYRRNPDGTIAIASVPPQMPQSMIGVAYKRCGANP